MPRRKLAAAAAFLLAMPLPAGAEALTSKTPDIESPQTVPVGQLDFPFTHRFGLVGAKVTNSPTFQLSTGLAPATSAALRWASNSRLGGGTDASNPVHRLFGASNEFELSVKQAILPRGDKNPLDLAGLLAYNTLANSGDLALVSALALGPVTLLGTGKLFSNGFGAGGYTAAAGAGAQWHLTKYLQVQADAGGVLWAQNDPAIVLSSNTPALSLGLGFEIPYSPHTALLYVSNADTHTLQGTSRGSPPSAPFDPSKTPAGQRPALLVAQIFEQLRFGFEFNIPFSSATRWVHIVTPAAGPGDLPEAPASEDPMVPPGGDRATPSSTAMPGETRATHSAMAMPATSSAAPPDQVPSSQDSPGPAARVPSPDIPAPVARVTITNFAFKPDTLTVPAGTTVRWENRDTVVHTATSDRPGWDSGNIMAGASYSRRFDKPGTYPYHCTPHPFMVGKVVVK